jgi:hypothetical protein
MTPEQAAAKADHDHEWSRWQALAKQETGCGCETCTRAQRYRLAFPAELGRCRLDESTLAVAATLVADAEREAALEAAP